MTYSIELDLDLPRDKVGELFGNPDNLAFWQPGFVSMEHTSGEEGAVGAKSRLLYKNRGRDVELIETVKVNNLPEEFTATYEAKGMWIEVKNRFEENGPEKTKWISENDVKLSGIMMRLIGLVMPGCFKKETLKYNVNFKAFAEKGADIRDQAK